MKNYKRLFTIVLLIIIRISLPADQDRCKAQGQNALSFQPLGMLTLWNSFEYERYLTNWQGMTLTGCVRLNMSSNAFGISIFDHLGHYNSSFWDGKVWRGLGLGTKLYFKGKKDMSGLYCGLNIDEMGYGDNQFDRISLEAGTKYVFGKNGGIFITPCALFYISYNNSSSKSYSGFKSADFYFGCYLGYQF